MEFKILFRVLKTHLSDGEDVPVFFREFMSMITTVSEEEWGTSKDPSSKRLKDTTIRSYTKRSIPKKIAETIIYRLTPEILEERINEQSVASRKLMADDLRNYDPSINEDNVAAKISEWVVNIIHESAGLVSQDTLQKKKQQELAASLKIQYGDYLLGEAEGNCPFPGCGRQLTVSDKGKLVPIYEVSLIDKRKGTDPGNLIAMCPKCYGTYLLDNSKTFTNKIQKIKNMLFAHRQNIRLLDDLPLEEGIIGVIRKIKNLGGNELENASLNPKEIKQKLDPTQDTAVYMIVQSLVAIYFPKVKEIMMSLDKRGEIDYDEIQDQIHAFYKKLKKTKKSQMEIFNEIVGKIHRVTLQEDIYCQIVVSYFVQSCEVFDAITK